MKHISAAIVTVAMIVAMFMADMPEFGLSKDAQDAWSQWGTLFLVAFLLLVAYDSKRGPS